MRVGINYLKNNRFRFAVRVASTAIIVAVVLIGLGSSSILNPSSNKAIAAAAQTLYFRSTASAVVSGTATVHQLSTTIGGSANTATTIANDKTVAIWQFSPSVAVANGTTWATSTSPDSKGWIFDAQTPGQYAATAWTINVGIDDTNASGTAVLGAQVFKVTANSTTVTSVTNLSGLISSSNITNIPSSLTKESLTFTPTSTVSILAGQYIYVELYLSFTVAGGSSSGKATLAQDDPTATLDEMITSTFSAAPTLTTPTAANIAQTTATLGANITAAGDSSVTAEGTCWSTTNSTIINTNCTSNGSTTTGVFTNSTTGLTASTTYYYDGYATNSYGTAYSPSSNFTTFSNLPTIGSPTATLIGYTTSTLGATITNGGGSVITSEGTCWGTTPNPTTNCLATGSTSTGTFTQSRTGLSAGTLYDYVGYAVNSYGTSTTSNGTFTTSAYYPDFTLSSSSISFSNNSPYINQNATATAVISNIGQANYTPFTGTSTAVENTYYNTTNSGTYGVYATQWIAQSFVPTVTSYAPYMSLYMDCTGTCGAITFNIIQNTGAPYPGAPVLASTTIPQANIPTSLTWFNIVWPTPPILTAGTEYWIEVEGAGSSGSNDAGWVGASSGSAGAVSTNSGASWGAIAENMWFELYVEPTLNVQFYNGNPSSGGKAVGPLRQISSSLAINATASVSSNFSLPSAGTDSIYAWVNASSTIPESSYTNNTASTSITVLAAPVPDFSISPSSITFSPNPPTYNQTVTTTVAVSNIGSNWPSSPYQEDNHFDTTNGAENNGYIGDDATTSWAVPFTPTANLVVANAAVNLVLFSDLPNVNYYIESNSSGKPSGTVLATSTTLNQAVFGTNGSLFATSTFFNSPTLTAGTEYWLVVTSNANNCTSDTSCIGLYTDVGGHYTGGSMAYNAGGTAGTWTVDSGDAFWFELYGNGYAPAEVNFYNGNPSSGGTQIGTTQVIGSMNSNTTSTAQASLTVGVAGTAYNIYADVDPYNLTGSATTSEIAFNTFTVASGTPTLTTPTSTSIASSSAVLGATLVDGGGLPITSRGVYWGISPTQMTNQVPSAATSTGAYTVTATGMSPGVPTYYEGYASNALGTGYSPYLTIVPSTVNYSFTSTTVSWIVPAGATSATITAVGGGGGGNPYVAGQGGPGGTSVGTLIGLVPSTTYYYVVGGAGAVGVSGSAHASGGYGGGGTGGPQSTSYSNDYGGGGGGGMTWFGTANTFSQGNSIIIGGGGGGDGGGWESGVPGGAGGGASGQIGFACGGAGGITGGGGGTQIAGGAAGTGDSSNSGTAGAAGTGGNGGGTTSGYYGGGGGGGGYYGGGGGGGDLNNDGCAGGGGGSGYISSALVSATTTQGTGAPSQTNGSLSIVTYFNVIPPTVILPTVTNIATTSATLGATVSANGGGALTSIGIYWGLSSGSMSNQVISGATSTGAFTVNVPNLATSTTIYYKGYASNSAGTSYSTSSSFVTAGPPAQTPTLTSPTATSISTSSAVLGANVTSNGGTALTAVGTCWGLTSSSMPNCNVDSAATSTGVYTMSVTGLTQNTTVYYEGYAVNSVGTSTSPYSSFNTLSGIATPVYYSVGQNTSNHMYLNPTLTITNGGVGTFSVGQTTADMGVGDAVTYNTNQVAYISGKTSSTVWTLVTATGTAPANISSSTVVSIAHAFSSLSNALSNASGTNFMNTNNLVTGNYVLNIPCYYDGNGSSASPDTAQVSISGYTTRPSNYINIYAPTATQANSNQRNSGDWVNNAYTLQPPSGYNGIVVNASTDYVNITGLQILVTDSGNPSGLAGISFQNTSSSSTYNVADNIISASLNSGGIGTDMGSAGIIANNPPSSETLNIWNNMIYYWNSTSSAGLNIGGSASAYVYNDTFYGNTEGIYSNDSYFTAKDVIANGDTTDYSGTFNAASEDDISQDASSPNPSFRSVTVGFTNGTSPNLLLSSSDTGTVTTGANLTSDSNIYNVNSTADIAGNPRLATGSNNWDMGANQITGGYPSYGTLQSAVFDTGVTLGAAYNSISWQGSLTGGWVGFQLATSKCSNGATNYPTCNTGTWAYYGPSCLTGIAGTSNWYAPNPNAAPMQLSCPSQNNNNRYFSYQVKICSASTCNTSGSATPVVSHVVVNWSP